MALQISVGMLDERGDRPLSIYSRPSEAQEETTDAGGEWVRHATGLLRAQDGARERAVLEDTWPPEGAEPVALDDLYGDLSELGFDFGPVSQVARAGWRRGDEIFAEVSLAGDALEAADRFCIHPALLDGTCHVAMRADGEVGRPRLPFAFNGVRLLVHGASALRARVESHGDEMSLTMFDESGAEVGEVRSVFRREITREQVAAAQGGHLDALFAIRWETPRSQTPARSLTPRSGATGWVVLGTGERLQKRIEAAEGTAPRHFEDLGSLCEALDGGAPAPELALVDLRSPGAGGAGQREAVRAVLASTLALVQGWLAEERLGGTRLVCVTKGVAVGAGAGAAVPAGREPVAVPSVDRTDDGEGDPALWGASAWGLLRSAQAEHPGRFVLVDVDGEAASWAALAGALELGEPQLALRDGEVLVPRLARLRGGGAPAVPGWRGTVLITGGLGGLGALLARHLAREHGVKRLLLTSRRGAEAAGARELVAELEGLGARVRVAACDVTDREQLQALLDSVSAKHPLSAVIHAAGTFENGLVDSLTDEQVERVLAPKLDGAWHLHELTSGLGLEAFVLFSSMAGIFGGPGQGNYAAANAFLDALAEHRHALGLPACAIAWGLWSEVGGGRDLGKLDAERMVGSRSIGMLSPQRGLELFDAALGCGEAVVVPTELDGGALRSEARAGTLPVLLSGLVRVAPRKAGEGAGSSLGERLAGMSEEQRERAVHELVQAQVAMVLGHASPGAIDARRAFKDLGFDSLTAVELRNSLSAVSGLQLPATLAFDYPDVAALAGNLLTQLDGLEAPPVLARASRAVSSTSEPIAIVGMSCRYPGGVRSPQELWELVAGGLDAISGFPENRGWDLETLFDPDPDRPGTSYAREGGFLHDAADFDAGFFGISPREALAMDPQQRLMLESCWEAFEDAAIDPLSLRGSQTGVFAGVMHHDYGARMVAGGVPDELEAYMGTGNAGAVASGRVAYVLGLEGPAMTVDTACSSSLVALHLACGSLRAGECAMALAGGVTVLATPSVFTEFSRQRGLAPDGRCKSFADGANGVAWSEGSGVLLLERLSDARRAGRRVWGVIRGSAVNQDGASNGLTAPNGPSQQRVIHQALANAGLSVAAVDAVEGHGTGTGLGDPIEAQALLATYGQDREKGRPLWLGSVKSNIGHTQAAAGVAGIIKMVMAMHHGMLPPTLHVDEPSRRVDWSTGAVSLLTEPVPWHRGEEPRRAAVSSFGLGGTNAHLILEEGGVDEEAPVEEPALTGGGADTIVQAEARPAGDRLPTEGGSEFNAGGAGVLAWVVSGRGVAGLCGQAQRLLEWAAGDPGLRPGDVGRSLAGRAALEDRAVVLGADREELLEGLGALARGEPSNQVVRGAATAALADAGIAFLFTGQGAQRVGMGRGLYEAFPVFRGAFEEVCGCLDDLLGCSLRGLVFGEGRSLEDEPGAGVLGEGSLEETLFTQTGLFALEVALFRLLEAWGVRPSFLMGHSIGELVAAHVAGVLSLEDACMLVAARGRLMGALPPGGAMVAVQASEAEALASLEGFENRVALAAVNGPSAVVLSGDEDAVLRLAGSWEERGRRTRRLRVSHAFHSPRMDGMLERFAEVARGLSFAQPRIPVVSNVTGEEVTEELCTAEHWVRHARETVRFAAGIRRLYGRGVRGFLELGPDAVLSAMSRDCLEGRGDGRGAELPGGDREGAASDGAAERDGEQRAVEDAVVAVPVLHGERPEARALIGALGEMWTHGMPVDWARVLGGARARRVALPTYAFQRQRFWLDPQIDGRRGASAVEDCRYRIGWKRIGDQSGAPPTDSVVGGAAAAGGARSAPRGVWLVVLPAGMGAESWVTSVVGALRECDDVRIVPVEVDGVRGADRGAVAQRLRAALLAEAPAEVRVDGVLSLLALEERPTAVQGAVPGGLAGTLALVQGLEDASMGGRLWLMTRGAVAVSEGDSVESPLQGMVWGLGRTLALEQPGRWGGLVDLPESLQERTLEGLRAVLGGLAAKRTSSRCARPVYSPGGSLARRPRGRRGSRVAAARDGAGHGRHGRARRAPRAVAREGGGGARAAGEPPGDCGAGRGRARRGATRDWAPG